MSAIGEVVADACALQQAIHSLTSYILSWPDLQAAPWKVRRSDGR
jgi:hypothetical protein